MNIIAFSDIHYSPSTADDSETVLESLQALVETINQHLQPDLICVPGDLVSDEGLDALCEIRKILDNIHQPTLVLPGNHDGDKQVFFEIIPPLPDFLDIEDCRIIPFLDTDTTEFNSIRSADDIARMKLLASEFNGPVISLQHVPLLFSESAKKCSDFNCINADEVYLTAKKTGITHTISGHYHDGCIYNKPEEIVQIACPAFYKPPHPYVEIEIHSEPPYKTAIEIKNIG